ncbi:hypothetical protein [Microvirga tunisiensis]|uniref:Uncharacterized protein n=1 Tax=Microvirga tunisiensis TaxID=2108360 RepID=A0A5N7MAS9_9HYPH|nr:hypothetical protein [Microvirga tunisiensis]MPR05550.1 hypothetical protein [Microvirga tunisiensis]MPR23750.1 hypothetical protein [Microvirga tunisiensis]
MQKYFVEGVHRMGETTFAVEISDTRYGYSHPDRTIWLEVESSKPDFQRVTRDLTTDTAISSSLLDLPEEMISMLNLAAEAVTEFMAHEEMVLLPINPDRKLEVVKVDDSEGIYVSVVTDRMVDGKPEQITLEFAYCGKHPTVDFWTRVPIEDDVRAFAMQAANEARRQRILKKIKRAREAKEAQREAEKIVALEEKRIAKKAEQLGCTPALAEYIDRLEARIEILAETVSRHFEDA